MRVGGSPVCMAYRSATRSPSLLVTLALLLLVMAGHHDPRQLHSLGAGCEPRGTGVKHGRSAAGVRTYRSGCTYIAASYVDRCTSLIYPPLSRVVPPRLISMRMAGGRAEAVAVGGTPPLWRLLCE